MCKFYRGLRWVLTSIQLKICGQFLRTSSRTSMHPRLSWPRFFVTRCVRACWKTPYLVPVHKKGYKSNACNYRGITSLCVCAKVFELLMYEPLLAAASNYISAAQYRFVPQRSTTTNLVEFVSLCHRTIDAGSQIDAVYTDIKAAFDIVSHALLLAKLETLGLPVQLLAWMRYYLAGRTYYVGPDTSRRVDASSGVPLLFVIFLNDVTRLLPPDSHILYANEAKLFLSIRDRSDQLRLQATLCAFQSWCSLNGLELCVEKCVVVTFARKRCPLVYDYALNGSTIGRKSCVTDPGQPMSVKACLYPLAGLAFSD